MGKYLTLFETKAELDDADVIVCNTPNVSYSDGYSVKFTEDLKEYFFEIEIYADAACTKRPTFPFTLNKDNVLYAKINTIIPSPEQVVSFKSSNKKNSLVFGYSSYDFDLPGYVRLNGDYIYYHYSSSGLEHGKIIRLEYASYSSGATCTFNSLDDCNFGNYTSKPIIDINPLVIGQYATVNINPVKKYVYAFFGGNRILKTTSGNYDRFSTGPVLTYNKSYDINSCNGLSSKYTPSVGVYIAPEYGSGLVVYGIATSNTDYASWDEIPDVEKTLLKV